MLFKELLIPLTKLALAPSALTLTDRSLRTAAFKEVSVSSLRVLRDAIRLDISVADADEEVDIAPTD